MVHVTSQQVVRSCPGQRMHLDNALMGIHGQRAGCQGNRISQDDDIKILVGFRFRSMIVGLIGSDGLKTIRVTSILDLIIWIPSQPQYLKSRILKRSA